MATLTSLDRFWNRYPALYFSLFLLIGSLAAFGFSFFLLLPIALLVITRKTLFPPLIGLSIGVLLMISIHHRFQLPSIDSSDRLEGQAKLHFTSLSLSSNHFGQSWQYRGTIKSFTQTDGTVIAKGIPITLYHPISSKKVRPKANRDYCVEGFLKKSPMGNYRFKPHKEALWKPIEGSSSPAETRYKIKQTISDWISHNIHNSRSASFLSGLATGVFSDRILTLEFSRFGLQHIMAISGFHFAIIASILAILLQLLANRRLSTIVLVLLLSSYYLLIGPGPSVQRAWMMALIAIIGGYFGKDSSPLNSLGIALGLILLFDPLIVRHIGFQFSFLVTGAILLLVPPIQEVISRWSPPLPLATVLKRSKARQVGQILLSFVKPLISLTIAVHLVVIPLTLYHFHKFPVLSLLYNLFIPFLISVSLLLLILSILTLPLYPLSKILFYLNALFTGGVLGLIYGTPVELDLYLYSHGRLNALFPYYLVVILLLGASLHERRSGDDSLPFGLKYL